MIIEGITLLWLIFSFPSTYSSQCPPACGPATLSEPTEMCSEAHAAAESACSKSEMTAKVSLAMPAMGIAATAGKDSSEAVRDQGIFNQAAGAANTGVGFFCLRRAKSCISACEDVKEACDCTNTPSDNSNLPLCQTKGDNPVSFDQSECKPAPRAIEECKELKSLALAAMAQGGLMSLAGQLMKNAGKGMKDDVEVAPPPPPAPPGAGGGPSPMSLGVSPLAGGKGPGQLSGSKTLPGQGGAPPALAEFADEEETPEETSLHKPLLSGGRGASTGAGGAGAEASGDLSGAPGEEGEAEDKKKTDGYYSNFGSGGGGGFLSGGRSRRNPARAEGGGGDSGHYGRRAGKRKTAPAKEKSERAKRDIFQKGSRHRSIFEVMSERIQSFCRQGPQTCE